VKTRLLAALGFKVGAVCLALSAAFLAVYFLKRPYGPGGEKSKKPVAWLVASAVSYFSAFGGLLFVFIAHFMTFIPNMGDFNSVQWTNGCMTASNGTDSFAVRDVEECFSAVEGRPFHRVRFNLQNLSDRPVTLLAYKVISRIDDQEVGTYRGSGEDTVVLGPQKSGTFELQTDRTERVDEHAKRENLEDYGLTAFLTVVTSAGKLPGIPIHFPPKTCP